MNVKTADGLSLFVREFGRPGDAVPVLCLPGLTRNSRDFEPLAASLAVRRRVLAMDFRGRGFSDYDPTGSTYEPITYATDAIAVLDTAGIDRACLIGTSLGGGVAMIVGATAPSRVAGIVLNDVGPVLDPAGFARIQSYAGKLPPVATWDEAVAQARSIAAVTAPAISDADWLARARQQYREFERGVIRTDHDPRIVAGMDQIDSTRLVDTWPVFEQLRGLPMLAIRGALSDVLAAATLDEMRHRKPDLATLVVADRGHTPTLDEPECRSAIEEFLDTL